MKALPIAVLLLALPGLLVAEPQKITVSLENSLMHGHSFQVIDRICSADYYGKCSEAASAIRSKDCRSGSRRKKCREAKSFLDSESCLAGMVFIGWLEADQKVDVKICTSRSGHGRLAYRKAGNTTWVTRMWIDDGDGVDLR